jgi:hypothetical protein
MRPTTCFRSFFALTLGAALGCEPGPNVPPPVGGQSGDDGGERDPDPTPPIPIPPGVPEPPCEPERTLLGAADATVLGASVQGLIDNLELGSPRPLFWVPFDEVAPTTFAPGPGETTLTLGVTLRPGESARQTLQIPDATGAACPLDVVSVPVLVSLTTGDGALDERFDATLEFTSQKVVHLSQQLSPDELTGSFAFGAIGAPAQGFQARTLGVEMELWPGGSRGSIRPGLSQTGSPTPPQLPAPYSDVDIDAPTPTPSLPEHWSAVAVWPRREVCPNDGRGGVAFDASDAVLGVSPLDVIGALEDEPTWALASDTGETPVQLSFEAPSGLLCVTGFGGPLEFDVRATLRADGAAAGSALEHLNATTTLSVGGRAAADGSGLVEVHWARRDVMKSQPRAAFEAATGLALEAADEYRDIWWSWQGVETRADAAAAWLARAALSVSSLNAEQAAAIASVVARGGPGVSVSLNADGFPLLPGDTLLEAELSP